MGYKDNDRCLARVDADEPIFVLRAQDVTAPMVISFWLQRARMTLTDEHRHEVGEVLTAMYKWQAEHKERVKNPD